MHVQQAIASFRQYCPQEQSAFLLHLAHALTIIARDTYEVGGQGVSQPARLRRINEMQHRVTSFLIALMHQDTRRYPDEVLMGVLLDHADDLELQGQIQEAVQHLLAPLVLPT